jgi:anaerobic selenocysteine-containing dehydrogenase
MKTCSTVCPRDCYDTCSIMAEVDDNGFLVTVEGDKKHPVTAGFLCPRGNADPMRVYRNRVLYPHVRRGKALRRASWNEALSRIAREVRSAISKHGPRALLCLDYAGTTGLLSREFPLRLWKALGATFTDYALCSKSGHEGIKLHYGSSHGIDPEELPDKKIIVYWGFNAAASSAHLFRLSLDARKKGALIIVVDSRESETARKADVWVRPQPGSDVALAYGIMRSILDHSREDRSFIDTSTSGFEELREEIGKWSPERVEELTGLQWSTVEELGRAYCSTKAQATMIGIGLQKSEGGAESVRAVSLIPALRGIHRGFFYSNETKYSIDYSALNGGAFSAHESRVVSQVSLAAQVARGDFAFIFISSMNPAESIPDQRLFREGLQRDDVFVALHDTHWATTSSFADIVLPAPTYLEKRDLVIPWSHKCVRRSEKVLEPLGESRDEITVMQSLARELSLREQWLYADPWKCLDKALADSFEDGTVHDLKQGRMLRLRCRKEETYETPSGKIEFYSKDALGRGFSPLPEYHRRNDNESFVLFSSSLSHYTHSQFQEVYGPIPGVVVINAEDAALLAITGGAMVRLFNEKGSLVLKASLSTTQCRGLLWVPKNCIDYDGRPLNLLSSATTQSLGGGPTYNSTRVMVEKVDAAAINSNTIPRSPCGTPLFFLPGYYPIG